MTISDRYREQVRLLMRLLPLVAGESCFALKGGTAIGEEAELECFYEFCPQRGTNQELR